MGLAYRRITEEQDKLRNIFPKGEYPFHVKSIKEDFCKNKVNKMLIVEINVMNENGRQITVKDWIMLDMEEMEWKLRHFAATCGLLDRYEEDMLEERDFLGKNGVAKLSIAEYEKDEELVKINRVADYIKPKNHESKPVKKSESSNDFIDDDISF